MNPLPETSCQSRLHERAELYEAARARARVLRSQAADAFWRDAGSWLVGTIDSRVRAASRYVASLARHRALRAGAHQAVHAEK